MSANGNTTSGSVATVDAGIFWDIENIPIHCARADEEARDAVNGMKKLVLTDHFGDTNHNEQEKTIRKFVIVARKPGDYEPTPQHCKDRLVAHGVSITVQRKRKRHVENSRTLPMIKLTKLVELIDLPFSRAKDYCDDEIIRVAEIYAKEYDGRNSKIVVYLMTGDKGIIRRVNSFAVPFDLIVVILRGNRELRNVTGHCRNVRRENRGTGRRLQIYMYEEVIRAGKGSANDFPVNDVEIFRREGVFDIDLTANANANGRTRNSVNRAERTTAELDESHFDILFR